MKKIFYILTSMLIACNFAYAKEVKVAFGMSKSPFVMEDNNSGIEISIAEEAFKRIGYTMKNSFVANMRLIPELKDKQVDASVSVQQDDPEFFYSQAFITYDNYAVTKKEKNIVINNFDDLKGKSIVAWQSALNDLKSKELNRMVEYGDVTFQAMPKQEMQVRNFLADRFDVIVIDKTILRYLANKLKKEMNLSDKDIEFDYSVHDIKVNISYSPSNLASAA